MKRGFLNTDKAKRKLDTDKIYVHPPKDKGKAKADR